MTGTPSGSREDRAFCLAARPCAAYARFRESLRIGQAIQVRVAGRICAGTYLICARGFRLLAESGERFERGDRISGTVIRTQPSVVLHVAAHRSRPPGGPGCTIDVVG